MLPGEAGIGQVFGRGAGADGDGHVGDAGARGEFGIRVENRFAARLGPIALHNRGANRRSGVLQCDLMRGQILHRLRNEAVQPIGLDEAAKRIRCGGETRRNLDAFRAQLLHHLAQ